MSSPIEPGFVICAPACAPLQRVMDRRFGDSVFRDRNRREHGGLPPVNGLLMRPLLLTQRIVRLFRLGRAARRGRCTCRSVASPSEFAERHLNCVPRSEVSMKLIFTLAVLFLSSTASAQMRSAQLVIPPSDGTGICDPFACGTRMQQLFDSQLFPSGIRIEALDFFHTFGRGFAEPATYRIFLSTTRITSSTVSSDFDANLGGRMQEVASFTITSPDVFFTKLTVPLTKPFSYNPATGSLLIEIRKDQTANHGDGVIYADGSVNAPGVTLVTQQFLHRHTGLSIGLSGRFIGRGTQ